MDPTFSLDEDGIGNLVPTLCKAITHYYDTTSSHRVPNRVGFFLRPDSGSIYVNLFGPKISRELGSISLPVYESQYYRIPVENFETVHEGIVNSMHGLIRESLINSPELVKLQELLDIHSLAISIIQYDDLETEELLDLST